MQMAAWSRKSRDHSGSHANTSFHGVKKLGTIKADHHTHAEHELSMATRVVEREESMALCVRHLRDTMLQGRCCSLMSMLCG